MKAENNQVGVTLFRAVTFCFVSLLCWAELSAEPANGDAISDNAISDNPISGSAISIDNAPQVLPSGERTTGNGEGDLVLVIYDGSDKQRRKSSLLVDLSFEEENGDINDLTCNDILKLEQKISIQNEAVTAFINDSKYQQDMTWQIFGIANHATSRLLKSTKPGRELIPRITMNNFGLVSTEQQSPEKPLDARSMRMSKALRSKLIKENNEFGIEPNGSLISYFGEPSAYDKRLYDVLTNGNKAYGKIGDTLYLGMHRQQVSYETEDNDSPSKFFMTHEKLGTAYLQFNEEQSKWSLIIDPGGK